MDSTRPVRIQLNRARSSAPEEVVAGLFAAQRAVWKAFRPSVLAGSGLTLETAELLVELFLASNRADGGISFQDLLAALDYTPGLLSRRIAWLCGRRWAETTRASSNPLPGVHGNCRKVKITELGQRKIEPVWRNYVQQSERLLAGIPSSDLTAHYRVSKTIVDRLCPSAFRIIQDQAVSPALKAKPALAAAKSKPPPAWNFVEFEKEFLD